MALGCLGSGQVFVYLRLTMSVGVWGTRLGAARWGRRAVLEARGLCKVLTKDSYRLIPMALAAIPESLGFKDKASKEVMYYNMYNYKTMDIITKMKRKTITTHIKEFNDNSHQTKQELNNKEKPFYITLENWE